MYQDVLSLGQDDEDWLKAYDRVLEQKADSDVTLEYNVRWYKERLRVPDSVDFRKVITQEKYNSNVAAHMDQEKMIQLVRRNFLWPIMDQWSKDYIRSCTDWQKNIAAHHACYGLLHPLDLAYTPSDDIGMDFFLDLQLSNGCLFICAVVNCFMKMSHIIPLCNKD